ncbi:MAG: DUF2510 domain-containing protein [Acidimicrobiales bacterium]
MVASTSGGVIGPGRYPDPARRHHVRWFDGREWTDHVAFRQVNQPGGRSHRDRTSTSGP